MGKTALQGLKVDVGRGPYLQMKHQYKKIVIIFLIKWAESVVSHKIHSGWLIRNAFVTASFLPPAVKQYQGGSGNHGG